MKEISREELENIAGGRRRRQRGNRVKNRNTRNSASSRALLSTWGFEKGAQNSK